MVEALYGAPDDNQLTTNTIDSTNHNFISMQTLVVIMHIAMQAVIKIQENVLIPFVDD